MLENLRTFKTWLQEQDIKTMIWGDMLISAEESVDCANAPNAAEAKRRRALVPQDVIVVDWHYNDKGTYPSTELFKQSGLKTIAATWFEPSNIRNFAHSAQSDALGLIQTTWAGFFPDETTLKTEMRQFSAFVLAGDYAWSNRQEMPSALPYDEVTEWWRAYTSGSDSGGEHSGALVDLGAAAQVPADDWLGMGRDWDLSALAKNGGRTKRRYAGMLFTVPKSQFTVLTAPGARGLAPAGSLGSLTLELNQKAGEVALLHTTLWPTAVNAPIGHMRVSYSDGTSEQWLLTQGQNISSWQRGCGRL